MKKALIFNSIIVILLVLVFTPLFQTVEAASLYTVKTGDSLWTISRQYNITIDKLIEYNDLSNGSDIYIGQKLILNPDSKQEDSDSNHLEYTVKAGDFLWNIAKKFDTTIEKLVELNNFNNSYELYIGRKLLIPVEDNYSPPAQDNDSSNDSGDFFDQSGKYVPYFFYNVKAGDHLWIIADNFSVSISSLIKYNDLENINDLSAGDILIIPLENSKQTRYLKQKSTKLNNYYRVRNGEHLNTIANFYQIPEEGIRAINQLNKSEKVYTGQKLLMPLSPAFFKEHKIYTVKSGGEYIFDIAYNHDISINSILKANYLKDNSIKFKAGTTLILPLDKNSRAVWINYENGKPLSSNSWFSN